MKWLGYKHIALKSIAVDVADIRRRMKEPHVKELADSVAVSGDEEINALVVRMPGRVLTCGRDRFAGAQLKKRQKIWAHLFEGSDEDAINLEAWENVHRRSDNRAELLAKASKARAELLRQKAKASGNTVAASDQSVKAQARKEVAKAAGVTPAAVKRAEQRTKAKIERHDDSAPAGHGAQGDPATAPSAPALETPGEGGPTPAIELPKGFDDLGIPMSDAEKVQARDVMANMATWAAQVTSLTTYLTRFEGKGSLVAGAHVQRIRERLQSLGHAYRDAIPVRRCFYCKGRPDLKPMCHACGQTGLMGRNDGENAPAELKTKGAGALVAAGGKFVPYAAAAQKAAKPAAPAKRVQVQDDAGNELRVEYDEEPAFQ